MKQLSWNSISRVLEKADRVLLVGPPGTGKTYAALTLGLEGREVFNCTLTNETAMYELRGCDVLAQGKYVWRDGPALRAAHSGGRLILNEIEDASGDAFGFIIACADSKESARITLPDGKTVTPTEGYQVVATSNADPEMLPQKILDRFPVVLHIKKPHPDAFTYFGMENLKRAAESMFEVGTPHRVGLRAMLAFEGLLLAGIERVDAAMVTLGKNWDEILQAITLGESEVNVDEKAD
jgi:hypothetical protein